MEESLSKHQKNIEESEDNSDALQEYVKTHFDKKLKLSNCKGEKAGCYGGLISASRTTGIC